MLGLKSIQVDFTLVELPLKARELVVAAVESLVSAVERLLTLHDSALHGRKLALALLLLSLGGLLDGENLLLGLKNSFLLCGFCLVGSLGSDAISLELSALNLSLSGLNL